MPKKREVIFPSEEEEAEIQRGIASDPDTYVLGEDGMKHMRPAKEVLPEQFGKEAAETLLKRRGRPALPVTKETTCVRYDRDVLAAFRKTGAGWQTRMNQALREYAVTNHLL